jgi:hypothetical protein
MTTDRGHGDDAAPPVPATDAALGVWAVTADALARGEQIFLLLPGEAGDLSDLEHEAFWIHPAWEGGDPLDLTEPYQDRLRALEDLRHDDGRIRLKYHATAEYLDALAGPEDLRPLDGEHTLSVRGVRSLFEGAPEGRVGLLVLRVYERRDAVMVPADRAVRRGVAAGRRREGLAGPTPEAARPKDDAAPPIRGRWLGLPEPVPPGESEPVLPDGRFLSEKARLLQRTGTMRAV